MNAPSGDSTPSSLFRAARTAIGSSLAALLVLVSGCAVDQDKEVKLYRDVLSSTVPPVPEYQDGESLTLARAMSIANQNNEQLGLQGEDYVQALINKNRMTAAFLPTVAFQPSFLIEDRPTGSQAGAASSLRTSGDVAHGFQAPVVGSINVFRGFGDVANLRAAEHIISQRRELLLDLQATVLLNVAQVYYQVLRSERSVTVLMNSLQVQQARLDDIQQQFHNGLATSLSVSQTRAQVASTRATLVQSRGDVVNGRSTLARLLGVPSITGPLTEEFTVPPPDQRSAEDAFEEQAIANRADLQAAQQAIEAAKQGVDAAIAQYYPSVSIDVAGFLYREYFTDASRWTAILSANIPIFSAGRIRADVRDAWSLLRQAALSEVGIRRQIHTDIQTSYNNLLTSESRLHELQDEVDAARDALTQASAAYANGLGINLDVLTAQDQLLTAELQLTSEQYDRTVFFLDLVRSTGRLHDVVAPPPPVTP